MQWFVDAAEPFRGMDINGGIGNHRHARIRSQGAGAGLLAITGITVTHDLIGEGDVVEKLQTQMQSGQNIYDAYVNDSDLIGTHWRYQQVRNLTDWMAGEGADVTSRTLDLDDFIGTRSPPRRMASCTSCPTSSSRTSTGSATTGSTTRRTRPISRTPTATNWACRSTGRPMRTSPSSSPAATSPHGCRWRGLWQHGLRQEGPVARLALHRRVDVDGRHGRHGRAQRPARR